jgi:hypothetical protein
MRQYLAGQSTLSILAGQGAARLGSARQGKVNALVSSRLINLLDIGGAGQGVARIGRAWRGKAMERRL